MAGDDLIGQARTGMGKTLAFGVPLLQTITTDTERPLAGAPRALIVVPTRELCLQVYGDLALAAKYLTVGDRKLSVVSIYGGRAYEPQIEALRAGADVVVGTPGGFSTLLSRGTCNSAASPCWCSTRPTRCSTSASCPTSNESCGRSPRPAVDAVLGDDAGPDHHAGPQLHEPADAHPCRVAASSAVHTTTDQFAYRAHALDKVEMVSRLLQARGRGATMVFTRTKRTAQKVSDELGERGFKVGAVHGDLNQSAREKALKAFRTGEIDVLVATDVAARGIDIDDVTHVINYQIPEDEQAYVHRIGRTGRAGKSGVAVTLIDWDELARWEMIDKALGSRPPGSGRNLFQLTAFVRRAGHPHRRDGQDRCGKACQGRQASAAGRRRGARRAPAPGRVAAPAAASRSALTPRATAGRDGRERRQTRRRR